MQSQSVVNHKILVVAASHDFRSGMRAMLEADGYEVLSRQSVDRTVHLLEVSEISMIVADFELEGGTYFDLLKAIKESDNFYSDVPIYCVGEKGTPDECAETFAAKADEYSHKPLNRKIFLARLKKIVNSIMKQKHNPVTLELRVEPGEIPGVFHFLEAETKTGVLKANCKKSKGEVTFRNGKIVKAETEFCAAQDALTEILSWPFCQLRFIEGNVEGEFDINLNVSSALMDCVFEVDEFKEVLQNYPDFEISFVEGDIPLPKNSNRIAKKVHRMASSGTIFDELLESVEINRRHMIMLIHQLVSMGHLKPAEPPFNRYSSEFFKQIVKSSNLFQRALPPIVEVLEKLSVNNLKPLDTFPINPENSANLTSFPRLVIAGDNPELTKMLFTTLQELSSNAYGKRGSIKVERTNESQTDLYFKNNIFLHLHMLPPKVDDIYLKQLTDDLKENIGVFFVVSAMDRETSRKNRTYLKQIREHFKGAYYMINPNRNPENPAVDIDCKFCFHRLTVDIDQSGSLGSCPICNTENIIPDYLEYTVESLKLEPEVPCVFMNPADHEECRDLLVLSCNSLLNAIN